MDTKGYGRTCKISSSTRIAIKSECNCKAALVILPHRTACALEKSSKSMCTKGFLITASKMNYSELLLHHQINKRKNKEKRVKNEENELQSSVESASQTTSMTFMAFLTPLIPIWTAIFPLNVQFADFRNIYEWAAVVKVSAAYLYLQHQCSQPTHEPKLQAMNIYILTSLLVNTKTVNSVTRFHRSSMKSDTGNGQ